MPIRFELAPFEHAYIGRARVQNGAQRWKFFVDDDSTTVIRGRDILTEADAHTPTMRLYVLVLNAYLDGSNVDQVFLKLARGIQADNPDAKPLIAEAFQHVMAGELAVALRPLKKLIKLEAEASAEPDAPAPFGYTATVPADYRTREERWQPRGGHHAAHSL
jgi:flagellar biosynthesis regulator FlbT